VKLSIVTPLYKSAPYIEELHRRSVATIRAIGIEDYEIIFVNDGSPDDSLAVARSVAGRDRRVVVLDLSRNFGQHRALLAGLSRSTGNLIFIMDSDLEEEPEWIGPFYQILTSSSVDVVYGVQIAKKRGLFYKAGRRLFYILLNALSDLRFPENVTTARLMTRRYVNAMMQFQEREVYMAGIWHVTGFTQMPVNVVKHDTSPTTYTLTKLAGVFVNAVTSFSTKPLIAIGIAGIGLSILAALFTAWIAVRKLVWGISAEGWASVMAATMLIGGLSLFFNGVMAIYIAKIFIEVKQRPRSIIREDYQQPHDVAVSERRSVRPALDGVRE
jgi:putative glycosyltransferase